MRIEILATGDELRLGEIVDTNSAYMSRLLCAERLEVSRTTVIGDDRAELVSAMTSSLARADVVLLTGGLGPTDDDLTREALAETLSVELETRPEATAAVSARYRRPLTERDLRQAQAPVGSKIIDNPWGTAPGIRAEKDGRIIYVMPGVPHEMYRMFSDTVLPEIVRMRLGETGASALRHFVVHGVPESQIANRLSGLASSSDGCEILIGTRVRFGTIAIRLSVRARTSEDVQHALSDVSSEIRKRLGDAMCGEGDHDLAWFAAHAALERGLTIAVAESCTGGAITSRLVGVSGVSGALVEGVVAYSNEAKVRRLGVDARLIEEHGAVSAEVARAMAEGIRTESGAHLSVATTGIAGPGGGSDEKPVGLVYLASASAAGSDVVEQNMRGDRNTVVERSTETALWLLLREALRQEAR
jgi:nicotinamide-nucleotide amidase